MCGTIVQSFISLQNKSSAAYVQKVTHAVKYGGYMIVSTFGPEGPIKCSGLDVIRYDAEGLHEEFGKRFSLLDSVKELHHIPSGTTQQFLYCFCRVGSDRDIDRRDGTCRRPK
jgi:hypothetical protein